MDWQAPGELLVLLALTANVIAGAAFFLLARGNTSFEGLARRAYHAFVVFSLGAAVWLYVLFFTHNYAFKYVFEYSQKSQPIEYIISAFWGGQEGTYLLWLCFNALFGYVLLKKTAQYRNWAMTVFATVNLFLLALLVKLSPFAYLDHAVDDGLGLNPLLRDPWMVVHPPVMFIGYATAGLPFAIAIAALIRNDFSRWVRIAFPWVTTTALALGAGNILGGFWAYKTLGWGGYWGWDPVENSSLVPWIISLALLHGMIIERRSSGLRKTNLLLSALLFLLVVYGTFLTRSGVLSEFSVHSFTDLGINGLLVGFLALFFGMTVIAMLLRYRKMESTPISYNFFDREFMLFSGLVTLLLFGVVVLVWMSLPLLSGWFTDKPRAADVATYNAFAQPMAVIIALLLAISPFTKFTSFALRNWTRSLVISAVVAAVVAVALSILALEDKVVVAVTAFVVVFGLGIAMSRREWIRLLAPGLGAGVVTAAVSLIAGVREPMHLLFFAMAAVALVSNVRLLTEFLPSRWRLAGGHLTHLGFAVMIIGILASSVFTSSQKLVLPKGEPKQGAGFSVTFNGLAGAIDQPNNEVLLLLDHDGEKSEGRPQLYFSDRMGGLMKKPYISRGLLHDTYFSPEEVRQASDEPLVLKKGEQKKVGGVVLTFIGYQMGRHDESESSMKVAAEIEAVVDGKKDTLAPALIHETGADTKRLNDCPN